MIEIKKKVEVVWQLEWRLKRARNELSQASAKAHGDNLSILCLSYEGSLRKQGVNTLTDLINLSENDLSGLYMMGRKNVALIQEKLKERNMYLKEI
jgi:DNA-directed RNA polymerase alpha subunit